MSKGNRKEGRCKREDEKRRACVISDRWPDSREVQIVYTALMRGNARRGERTEPEQ